VSVYSGSTAHQLYLNTVGPLVKQRRIETLAEQLQLDLIEHVRQCLELVHVLEHIREVLEHVLKVLVLGLAQIIHGQVRQSVRHLIEQLLHVVLLSTLHQIGRVRHVIKDFNVQRDDANGTILLIALTNQSEQCIESALGAKVIYVVFQQLRSPVRIVL